MTIAIDTAKPIPWWKEPTKEQWLAWVGRLARLDLGCLRLHDFPVDHAADLAGVSRAADRGDGGFHDDLVDAAGRRNGLRLARRSDRTQEAADDLDRLVFGRATSSPRFRRRSGSCFCSGRCSASAWVPNGRAARRWRWNRWPIRSRGFMAGVLQASWGLGALLSSAAYGLLYNSIGWRGLLMIGVLPALSIVYVRKFVKEPPVWVENRRLQRAEQREVRVPLFKVFKRGMLSNTLTACWWMASAFVVGYSIGGLFPTYLQKDLHLSPGLVALPVMLQSIVFFLSGSAWGWAGGPHRPPVGDHHPGPDRQSRSRRFI